SRRHTWYRGLVGRAYIPDFPERAERAPVDQTGKAGRTGNNRSRTITIAAECADDLGDGAWLRGRLLAYHHRPCRYTERSSGNTEQDHQRNRARAGFFRAAPEHGHTSGRQYARRAAGVHESRDKKMEKSDRRRGHKIMMPSGFG